MKSYGSPLIHVGVQVLDLVAWLPPLICLTLQRRKGKFNEVKKDHGILGSGGRVESLPWNRSRDRLQICNNQRQIWWI